MPWSKTTQEEQRLRLVIELLKPDCNVSRLCQEFGISRKTAYKWKSRYKAKAPDSLRDRSRSPCSSPKAYESQWRSRLRRERKDHPYWGPKKLSKRLREGLPEGAKTPAVATVARWLRKEKLIGRKSRRARRGPELEAPMAVSAIGPNDVWTVDFKGRFHLSDGSRCEPLTVRDQHSRYILAVFLLKNQSDREVRRCFLELFKKYGMPKVIKSDNGTPFGGRGPLGLSKLSVWWMRLGIKVEFSRPGHPEDNAGHEQMHRVMKAEAVLPAGKNPRAQNRRMKHWVKEYDFERPHEALGQNPPSLFYQPSSRKYCGKPKKLEYGSDYEVRRVRNRGNIKWKGRLCFVGRAFVGESIGLKEGSPGVQKVYLGDLLIGELHEKDLGGMRPASWVRKRRSQQNPEKALCEKQACSPPHACILASTTQPFAKAHSCCVAAKMQGTQERKVLPMS